MFSGQQIKNILFIPFAINEDPLSLYVRACDWRYNLSHAGKLNKIPDIVMYKHDQTSIEDHDLYKDVQFKFTLQNILPGTTIYIIADGTGNPNFVSNTNEDDDAYLLPIDLVAARAMQIGLTPELAKNLKSLKLFMCDIRGVNHSLAINFAQTLGKNYSNVRLNYYTAPTITLPLLTEAKLPSNTSTLKVVKKLAQKIDPVSQNLIEIGFASEHKKTISVQNLLSAIISRSPNERKRVAKHLRNNTAIFIAKSPHTRTIATVSEPPPNPVIDDDIKPSISFEEVTQSLSLFTPTIEQTENTIVATPTPRFAFAIKN